MIDPLELIRLAKDISSKFADQMCKRDRETRRTMNWINDPTFLYNTSIICFDDAIHWLKWQSINLIATLCLAHFVICLFADLRSFNHLVGLFVYLFGWWCCRIAIVYHRDLSCLTVYRLEWYWRVEWSDADDGEKNAKIAQNWLFLLISLDDFSYFHSISSSLLLF